MEVQQLLQCQWLSDRGTGAGWWRGRRREAAATEMEDDRRAAEKERRALEDERCCSALTVGVRMLQLNSLVLNRHLRDHRRRQRG